MEPSIEEMNDELVAQVANESVEQEKTPKKEIKKNSKRHIVEKIFLICEEYNFSIEETESQLLRKTRKKLLELLASYVERSMESKIKSEANGIPVDCQESRFQKNLPMLRLAHGFFASLVEKGFNCGCSYMEYQYELKNYAKTCNDSMLVDDVLISIADDLGDDLISYMSSPYLRLLFIHCTSMMSCITKIDKEEMKSPRFTIDKLNVSK